MGTAPVCRFCALRRPATSVFSADWCGTGRDRDAAPVQGQKLMLRADPTYTFGLAVEVAMRLEWWCDPGNRYCLRSAPKRDWAKAVAAALYRGDKVIPFPEAFGVKPHWKVDVLQRARQMGLPF